VRYNVLYVCKEDILPDIQHLNPTQLGFAHDISHPSLGDIVLRIFWIASCEQLGTIARHRHIDLIVYDERPPQSLKAARAVEMITQSYARIAEEWGFDFAAPKGRIVAVLRKDAARQAFQLGQSSIKEICVEPRTPTHIILWLKRILERKVFHRPKMGLALAGGGLEGFLYQLGTLYTLKHFLGDFRSIKIISGISCGAITGMMLAGDIDIDEVLLALHGQSKIYPPITSKALFDLASTDFLKRLISSQLRLPSVNPSTWWTQARKAWPTGFLKGALLEKYFADILGVNDHFDRLKKELIIGATDQDTYQHQIFTVGSSVKVSEAVRASIGIPPFFIPKKIGTRYYIDGQITRTTHIEQLTAKNCSNILIINPLKPSSTLEAGSAEEKGGLYTLTQMLKALVSSRFRSNIEHITDKHPHVDFTLFEPDEECAHAMQGLPMKLTIRTEITAMAIRTTARRLIKYYDLYEDKFAKLDIKVCDKEQLSKLSTYADPSSL
jgi:NTE family protein